VGGTMSNDTEEEMTSEQYEADAKADHRTSEQFPNV